MSELGVWCSKTSFIGVGKNCITFNNTRHQASLYAAFAIAAAKRGNKLVAGT